MLRRIVMLVAVGVGLLPASAYAQIERVWEPAGPMTQGRNYPAAAVLADGRVLVVGGTGVGAYGVELEPTATAEVHDPVARTWTPVASMAYARTQAAAITLRDGKVLVIGGDWRAQRAEVYDAQENRWTLTGEPRTFINTPLPALLSDGRVFVVDGGGSMGQTYEPETNTWVDPVQLKRLRSAPTVVALSDGTVLIAGEGTAEIYDPQTRTSRLIAAPLTSRLWAGGVLLRDGRVLIAGGSDGADGTSAELFDPATESWSATGKLAYPHRMQNMTVVLADGTPMIIGGTATPDTIRHVGELYDVASGTWTATGPFATQRFGASAVALRDGSALVVGGSGWDAINQVERLITRQVIGDPPPPPPRVTPPVVTPTPTPKAGRFAVVRPLPRTLKLKRGTVTVKLQCTGGACTDTLALKHSRKTLARTAVKAAAGRTITVKLKLKSAPRARKTTVSLELARQKQTIRSTLQR